jgi:hypothetical protein
MTKKETCARLAQTKLALAEKYDNLVRVTKSRPRQQSYRRLIVKFRQQAADLQRAAR